MINNIYFFLFGNDHTDVDQVMGSEPIVCQNKHCVLNTKCVKILDVIYGVYILGENWPSLGIHLYSFWPLTFMKHIMSGENINWRFRFDNKRRCIVNHAQDENRAINIRETSTTEMTHDSKWSHNYRVLNCWTITLHLWITVQHNSWDCIYSVHLNNFSNLFI